jgi:hypothetical protein
MFSWLSPFAISEERQWVIRQSVVEASTYLSAIKAERKEVYRMWEASEFRDPDLRHKHLDLDDSVAVVSTIHILYFCRSDNL